MISENPEILPTEGSSFASELLEIRARWNIARHPFYSDLRNGLIGLDTMARLLAQQYHHITSVLPSLALIYYKAPVDHRDFILTQMMSEGGKGGARDGQAASSTEYILRFCESAGLQKSQVEKTTPLPAWRARALFNIIVAHEESFASYLAIKSVTEGQQWALNRDIILPALDRLGYANDDSRIDFFTRHFISNAEFGERQILVAADLLPDAGMREHARALAEETGRLYWHSMNDFYRTVVRGDTDPMPWDMPSE